MPLPDDTATPLATWKSALAEWRIPDHILAVAPESPWTFPVEPFARRADRAVEGRRGPSLGRAEEALPDGGTVLDVGTGGGAASLPLAGRASRIVGVDPDPGMLEDMRSRAARIGARVGTIAGTWPDVAGGTPVCDVALCHHVLYNVGDLEPFVDALTSHARRRVVVEITERHPVAWMNPLWRRFHGLERPDRPTADVAAAALRSLGLEVGEERWDGPEESGVWSFGGLVVFTRRRLCLPVEAEPEVAAALADMGVSPESPTRPGAGRGLVTFWWKGTGD